MSKQTCLCKYPVGNQDKNYAPHIACKPCVNNLIEWMFGKHPSVMPFFVPMVWCEPKDHSIDYCFCLTNTKGYSLKIQFKMKYPDVLSPRRPMPHIPELPVLNPTLSSTSESESSKEGKCTDPDFKEDLDSKMPHDLIRALDLPKEKSELHGS